MKQQAWFFALLIAGCSSPPAPETPELAPTPGGAPAPGISRDPALYQEYEWPADWPVASDENGKEMQGVRVAQRQGDRQVVVADSASVLFGHEGKLKNTVVVFGSHCGINTAQLVNKTRPLGVIGHDAGVGLHAGGIQCISFGDKIDLPAATVSADTAYIGAGMSLWTVGKISAVNKSAEALGVLAGMSSQEAAKIMMAAARTPPEPR